MLISSYELDYFGRRLHSLSALLYRWGGCRAAALEISKGLRWYPPAGFAATGPGPVHRGEFTGADGGEHNVHVDAASVGDFGGGEMVSHAPPPSAQSGQVHLLRRHD
jgi:hypothetical protein